MVAVIDRPAAMINDFHLSPSSQLKNSVTELDFSVTFMPLVYCRKINVFVSYVVLKSLSFLCHESGSLFTWLNQYGNSDWTHRGQVVGSRDYSTLCRSQRVPKI